MNKIRTFRLPLTLAERSALLLGVAMICVAPSLRAQPASDPLRTFWRTDGAVLAMAVTNGIAYVGGDFRYLGPPSGGAELFSASTGDPLPGFPGLDGRVNTIIPDGVGGWYAGGDFVTADPLQIQNLVHVRADNSVDPAFKPAPNSPVRALALAGGRLLVGGEFFQIANNQVSYFAILNPATGQTNGTRLRVAGVVSSIAVDGDTAYLGGQFNSVTSFENNQQVNNQRQRLVAIDLTTGAVLAWNPTCSGGSDGVRTIALNGSTIYVGGDFTQCGGKPRNAIAALNNTDGTANNWNPNPQLSGGFGLSVNAIAVVGNVLYAGGNFTTIGARGRTRLAALQAGSFGQADANWQADANDVVDFIVPFGSDLLVGGKFSEIGGSIEVVNNREVQTGGTERLGFARIAQATADVTEWGPQVSSLNPQSAGSGLTLGMEDDRLVLGGDFISFGGANRERLAAIDLATGKATAWNPGADNTVRAMSIGAGGIFVGGSFTNVGGLTRPRIALVDRNTGQADSWDGKFTTGQYVSALAAGPSSVFVGGQFTGIGGQSRQNLAELDYANGDATAWMPDPSGQIMALMLAQDNLYVGGNFFGISGASMNYLALVSTGTAAQPVSSFNPQPDGAVRSLSLTADRLFVGGDFTKISGLDRNRVAAIDPLTAQESSPFDAQISGVGLQQVRAVLPLGQAVYVGGQFRGAGGENRGRVASVHVVFGAATRWDPGADGAVNVLARSGNVLLMGGEFSRLGQRGPNPPLTSGKPAPYLVAFDTRPAIWNLRKNSTGHYTFELTDGDGLGSSLRIQAADDMDHPNWTTLQTLDILGLQDPYEDTTTPLPPSRYYRLVREP